MNENSQRKILHEASEELSKALEEQTEVFRQIGPITMERQALLEQLKSRQLLLCIAGLLCDILDKQAEIHETLDSRTR